MNSRRFDVLVDWAGRVLDLDKRARADARDYYERLLPPIARRLTRVFDETLSSRALVDFGCGYDYPLVCMLAPRAREMVGVDVCAMHQPRRPQGRLGDGLVAAARRRASHEYTSRVHRHLVALAGRPASGQPYLTFRSDGMRIPLPDGFADAVLSNAVLQELPLPLERFAREMHRVLKPGGYVDLEWHNFYSFSGNYGDHRRRHLEPWGHLLGGPIHPRLNRLRPEEVVAAFSPWFSDIRLLPHDALHRTADEDADYEEEGREYLTPELASRLSGYPRSLLLTRGYFLLGFKR